MKKGRIILVTMLAVIFMASTVHAGGDWWNHSLKHFWKKVSKLEKKVDRVEKRSKRNSKEIWKLKKTKKHRRNRGGNTAAVDLDALKAQIVAELKADASFMEELKGEKGEKGDPGENGEDGSSGTFMSHWESFTTYNGKPLKLAGVNLKEARILESYFYDSDLSDANLKGAKLDGSYFNSVNGTTTLAGADMTGASVVGTDFTGCDFTDAVLKDVNLSTALSVNGAIWSNTTCPDGTNSDDNDPNMPTCEGHLVP